MPQSFEGHTSMRAGLLVNEDAFVLANVPGCDNKSNLENLGFCYLEKEGLTTYTYSISALKGSWTDVPPGCSLQTGGDYTAHYNTNSAVTPANSIY